MHAPNDSHMTAVKRILRFLKGTIKYGLLFRPGSFSLQAFCDADWAGSPYDRRSTSGFCVFLGPNPVSWSSKKQPIVARSSTDAEYRCLAQTAAEVTQKQLEVRFISTLDQVAGIFTKGLHSGRVHDLHAKLHVRPRPHQLEEGSHVNLGNQGNTKYRAGGNNPQVGGNISAGTGGDAYLGHRGYGGANGNSGIQAYGGGNVNSGNQGNTQCGWGGNNPQVQGHIRAGNVNLGRQGCVAANVNLGGNQKIITRRNHLGNQRPYT